MVAPLPQLKKTLIKEVLLNEQDEKPSFQKGLKPWRIAWQHG